MSSSTKGIMNYKDKVAAKIDKHFCGILKLIDPFVPGGNTVTIQCTKCGYIWSVRYYSLMHNNKGCKKCNIMRRAKLSGINRRRSHADYIKQVKNMYGLEYIVTGTYINKRTKVKVLHTACGNEWKVWPNNLLNGKGCPVCNRYSKGERYTRDILSRANIPFVEQYSFDDLRGSNGRKFYFDFAIFDDNRLRCLIELDGDQHRRPVSIWGGQQELDEQIRRDHIKDEYCKQHSIKLFRVRFNNVPHDLENIINNILKEC